MINFLFCTVLPPEASEIDQTHKFEDFFRSYTVLSDLTGKCFDLNELGQ